MTTANTHRLIENLLQLGTVHSVDTAAARCTVAVGDLLTAPVPWLVARAGSTRTWWAPTVGEQVLLVCPGGDPARAVALPGIYSDAYPAPDTRATTHAAHYPDGAVISYDPDAHQLTATLPAGGKADITADGGVHITGDTTITGKLHLTGKATLDDDVDCAKTITADTDVVAAGISLVNHKHKGVTTGTGITGKPQ